MMTPEAPGIYRLVNLVSRDVYVGSAENLLSRERQHRADMAAGRHTNRRISQLVQLHGADSFVFEVLEQCDAADLHPLEADWISHMQPSLNFTSPPGTDCLVDDDLVPLERTYSNGPAQAGANRGD